jgi:hypothetical protein
MGGLFRISRSGFARAGAAFRRKNGSRRSAARGMSLVAVELHLIATVSRRG